MNDDSVVATVERDPLIAPLEDVDTEVGWDDWQANLRENDGTGTVRAYKLPMGPDGAPNPNVKGSRQILLGSWPHLQFDFDSLCEILKRDFMKAGETAGFRVVGIPANIRDPRFRQFNKYFTLMRGTSTDMVVTAPGGPLAGIADLIRAQGEMMERLAARAAPAPQGPGFAATLKEYAPIFVPILAPALAAWIGRPKEKSDMGQMIDAMVALREFSEGSGSRDKDDDTSLMGLIKAVAPAAIQGFAQLATKSQSSTPATNVRVPAARTASAALANVPRTNGTPAIDRAVGSVSAPVEGNASSETIQPENQTVLAQLKPQIDALCDMAANGADAVETAKLVMDTLPESEELDTQLFALVSDEAAFHRLGLLSPRMKDFRPWFEVLRTALLAEFTDDKEQQTNVA